MAQDGPCPTSSWPPPPSSPLPAWVPCSLCEDFLCTIHEGEHAADCECPPIDEWACDPYSAGGRPTRRRRPRPQRGPGQAQGH